MLYIGPAQLTLPEPDEKQYFASVEDFVRDRGWTAAPPGIRYSDSVVYAFNQATTLPAAVVRSEHLERPFFFHDLTYDHWKERTDESAWGIGGRGEYYLAYTQDQLWGLTQDEAEDATTDWYTELARMAPELKERLRKQKISRDLNLAVSTVLGVPASVPPQRQRIPDDVKMFVWQRDQGKCTNCGTNRELEFDHIIPLAMGGSNTARNLQLLCGPCNRVKGPRLTSSA